MLLAQGRDRTQLTGIGSSKVRGMLTAAGLFPCTPSQKIHESQALPALCWEPESHTHSSAPEKA